MRDPQVTLVFVTLNTATFIGKALDSVRALNYPEDRLRTVLVDNASTDDTVRIVRENYPWVTIIPEAVNHGFAIANNIGMKAHPADYYALVNGDVVLHPDWLAALVKPMEADPSIGVAGSKVFYGNRLLLQHTGGMIRDNALTYHLGVNEFDIGQHDELRDVDYVIGAAMLMRGDVTREVGYLPEVYFPLYYEETEFCTKVRKARRRVVYVPESVAYHDEKRSRSGAMTRRFLRLYHRHRYLYAIRNLTTPDEQRKFRIAERRWQNKHVLNPLGRVLLWNSKLHHWRLLLNNSWLLFS